MCSIVEDDFGDDGGEHAMKENTPQLELAGNEICRKCNSEPAVLKLNLKDPQCRQCFLNYVRHKFRASLGSSKIVRRGSRVLVIYTGTAENVTLLDMIRFGLEQDSFKQLRIVPVLLFVDDSFVTQTPERRQEQLSRRLSVLRQFNFPSYYTTSGSGKYIELPQNDSFSSTDFDQEEAQLIHTINAVRSVTSKQDLLQQIRMQTYRKIAKELSCAYVFLSDIGVDLAKTLLSNVVLGRGCTLAQDVAFCDDRDDTVKIIRPVRDINPDEIQNYLQYSEMKLDYLPNVDHFGDKPSLQNLTAAFIDNLQQSFPSTVSTVFRTGDKLDAPKSSDEQDHVHGKCCFCGALLDYRGSKTLFATEYSRLVSSRINASCNHDEILEKSKRMEVDAERAVNGEAGEKHDDLMKNLCHGCRNIFVDIDK
ncbi:cytoplasmic tRNA 2-thiolation protein 2 [Anopheles ziemanni]|uniref:cytoplasmic tRNA 2-thiolation protein 2 n=1 Tax=Anopheles coustani TaxID=139045 RepID=UPI002657DAD7|nr:cytoplasmic tRNA 2-thiolation protein 2 [Anopheles coustani]XP_058166224.1 cytoplasmic tRNA 2-thiolation protein 2 [Anopheles ziemanni]